ncbi:hypothetical protein PFISCL1PPCAC_25937 [Pristionchus fissidentatus]|uniref:Uncharacterized protein n=1 Tax=Pristionchus fissidentatus TaxID=1538716 RepID=A0AAV5WSQ9_9BILA|nr:hypothetical protein PFISCL1PPCAC_25937 [Pristionchus fissidentatus]
MAGKQATMKSMEEASPLNEKVNEKGGHELPGFDFQPRLQHRGKFLSPFLCGTTPKKMACIHLGVMALFSLSMLILCIVAATGGDVLFYVGLIGAPIALFPLPFVAAAIFGIQRNRPNLTLPLIVLLCFLAISSTAMFAFGIVMLWGADTNFQPAFAVMYIISMTYYSHAIRVLLRIRLDLLEGRS